MRLVIEFSLVSCNFITLAKAILKLPEDGAEAKKHVGAFVI